MNRYFADVSNNQSGAIDFDAYRRQGGHVLVGLKATEGTGFVDGTHAERCQAAHKAGVWVAHYHFLHAGQDGAAQADAFWRQVKPHIAARDYLVLDAEGGGFDSQPIAKVVQVCRAFDARLRAVSRHQTILYSDDSELHALVDGGYRPSSGKVWDAAYRARQPVPPRGLKLWGWQRTDGQTGPAPHDCAGVGQCDVSVLNVASYLWLRARRPPR